MCCATRRSQKITDYLSLTGQFVRWDERDIDGRLRQFWAITKKYIDYGVVSVVEHRPYQAAFRGKISKTYDHSYFYVVTRLMMRVLSREGVIERRDAKVNFVFDQQELGQKREILSYWELYETHLTRRSRSVRAAIAQMA